MERVEFRIKQENVKWEDTPVYVVRAFYSRKDILDFAIDLVKIFQAEVRWNFEGLSQGHYVNEVESEAA